MCGGEEFVGFNARKNAACKICGSLERTRLLWLYLKHYDIDNKTKILHIAPERSLFTILSKFTLEENYTTADLFPDKYRHFDKNCKRIDLCRLDCEESNYYDFIIHSHVMEHVPCNIAYPLFHLHRMLKDTGRHICIIPFLSGKYDEAFQDLSDEERTIRFGQNDHVRRFGKTDLEKHIGSIINLPKDFDATRNFSEKLLTKSNIPSHLWKGFQSGTVLDLSKYDYKLV